jgi:hypothetical protein
VRAARPERVLEALPRVRSLIFAGEYRQAPDLVQTRMLGKPPRLSVTGADSALLLGTIATSYRRYDDVSGDRR